MNVKRVAALHREIAALHAELAAALEEQPPKRERKKLVTPPEVEVTEQAKDGARRALRRAGVAA